MTTPKWLDRIRDLRAAIAADRLTLDGAADQAATEPETAMVDARLVRTLLSWPDESFEAFADYENPAPGSGKSDMLERHMRAMLAAPGRVYVIGGDSDDIAALPRLSPEDLAALALHRGGEGKTHATVQLEYPEGVRAVDFDPPADTDRTD